MFVNNLNNIKKTISTVFIILALFSIYNFTFNGHYHKLSDGTVVYHYHPYNSDSKVPIKTHSHSQLDLLIISMFNANYVILTIIFTFMLSRYRLKSQYFINKVSHILNNILIFPYSLRAPPVLF